MFYYVILLFLCVSLFACLFVRVNTLARAASVLLSSFIYLNQQRQVYLRNVVFLKHQRRYGRNEANVHETTSGIKLISYFVQIEMYFFVEYYRCTFNMTSQNMCHAVTRLSDELMFDVLLRAAAQGRWRRCYRDTA